MDGIGIAVAAISCALSIMMGTYSISNFGVAAFNAMARQPEVAERVQSSMTLPMALIEGAMLMGMLTSGGLGYLASLK